MSSTPARTPLTNLSNNKRRKSGFQDIKESQVGDKSNTSASFGGAEKLMKDQSSSSLNEQKVSFAKALRNSDLPLPAAQNSVKTRDGNKRALDDRNRLNSNSVGIRNERGSKSNQRPLMSGGLKLGQDPENQESQQGIATHSNKQGGLASHPARTAKQVHPSSRREGGSPIISENPGASNPSDSMRVHASNAGLDVRAVLQENARLKEESAAVHEMNVFVNFDSQLSYKTKSHFLRPVWLLPRMKSKRKMTLCSNFTMRTCI